MAIDQETFDRLKELWQQAGGAPGRADIAAAIAFAESSGCRYALAGPVDIRPVKLCHWTRTNGENSCGYWQINLRAHPSYKAPGIFGELENARAAVAISGAGEDFGAWTTYTKGYYKQYLSQFGGGVPVATPTSSWATGWKHLSGTLARTLPGNLAASKRYRRDGLRTIAARSRLR